MAHTSPGTTRTRRGFFLLLAVLLLVPPAIALEPPPSPELDDLTALWQGSGDPADLTALRDVKVAEDGVRPHDRWALDVLEGAIHPTPSQLETRLGQYEHALTGRASVLLRHADRLYGPVLSASERAAGDLGPEVVDLHDARFRPAIRRLGLFSPGEWMRRVRGGILAANAPDATRPIVLFIHGSGGAPDDFDGVIARLDPTRAQAWMAYYPTGQPIERSAAWLLDRLSEARARFPAPRLYLVAHSLGGLVLRQMVRTPGADRALAGLQSVVFASTPHAGVTFGPPALFRLVCNLLDRFVPTSSRQLLWGSAYLKQLNAVPEALPDVHAMGGNTILHPHLRLLSALIPGENDGYVAVWSARYPGAVTNQVVPEDHLSIARSTELTALLTAVLHPSPPLR